MGNSPGSSCVSKYCYAPHPPSGALWSIVVHEPHWRGQKRGSGGGSGARKRGGGAWNATDCGERLRLPLPRTRTGGREGWGEGQCGSVNADRPTICNFQFVAFFNFQCLSFSMPFIGGKSIENCKVMSS